MGTAAGRILTLTASAAIIFGVTVAIGLKIVPGPHTESDYLVIGSVATLLALVVLFAVLLTTWLRSPDVFYKKRPKGENAATEESNHD
jgi:membrane protein DedA with SNARE-associated domain